jgi:hypothetical protein
MNLHHLPSTMVAVTLIVSSGVTSSFGATNLCHSLLNFGFGVFWHPYNILQQDPVIFCCILWHNNFIFCQHGSTRHQLNKNKIIVYNYQEFNPLREQSHEGRK